MLKIQPKCEQVPMNYIYLLSSLLLMVVGELLKQNTIKNTFGKTDKRFLWKYIYTAARFANSFFKLKS